MDDNIIYAKYIVEKEKEKMKDYEKIDYVVATIISSIIQMIEKNKCVWYDNLRYLAVPINNKYLLGNKNIKILYNFCMQNWEILAKCNCFDEHLAFDHDTQLMINIKEELKKNGFNLIDIMFNDIHGGDFCVYLEVI